MPETEETPLNEPARPEKQTGPLVSSQTPEGQAALAEFFQGLLGGEDIAPA